MQLSELQELTHEYRYDLVPILGTLRNRAIVRQRAPIERSRMIFP